MRVGIAWVSAVIDRYRQCDDIGKSRAYEVGEHCLELIAVVAQRGGSRKRGRRTPAIAEKVAPPSVEICH